MRNTRYRILKPKLERTDPERRVWECLVCHKLNAWNWEDAQKARGLLKEDVAVCSGSCFDNICGHCHADIVRQDSPIMATCYSHQGE